MRLNDLTLDLEAVDNGAWVGDLPDLEGVRFLVRGTEYLPYQKALRAALMQQGRRQRIQNQADIEKFDLLTRRLTAEYLLLGWEGLEDQAGVPIPYTLDAATLYLTERRYRPVQRGVMAAIERVDAGLADFREEAEGN